MVLAAVLALVSSVDTELIERCASSAERAEHLKKTGHFIDSLELIQVCAVEECPRAVRDLCRQMRAEIDTQVPTLVLEVRDETQARIIAPTISLDGQVLPPQRRMPLAVDPGIHTLELSAPGFFNQRLELTIRSGEKLRPVVVSMRPDTALTGVASPRVEGSTAALSSFPRWPAIFATAGALVGVGLFTGFGLSARNDVATLQTSCAPDCSDALVGTARFRAGIADGSLVGAVLFAALATYLWVKAF